MTLLIDNYDSFTYNLFQLLEKAGEKTVVLRNDQLTMETIRRLRPNRLMLSPGPGRPESAGVTLEALEHFSEQLPILGVCLGHQAIGQFFGGKVVRAKTLMHGKTSKILHSGKELFENMANPFLATRYHSLIVESKSLPKSLEVTAHTEDGVIMALQHYCLPIYGVQFHPESCLTEAGSVLIENFLKTGVA